jgi:7tm Chemosensory receptor
MMTTFTIAAAALLLMEEAFNWRGSFNAFLNLLFVWLLTIMGLLVTFKMLLVVYAIKVVLRDINKKVHLSVQGIECPVKLTDLIEEHATLCELVGETNRIFQPLLMCSHMMNFINLLNGSYYVTLIAANLEKTFVANKGPLLFGTIIWLFVSGTSLIFICMECDNTVQEVYRLKIMTLKINYISRLEGAATFC